MRARLRLLRRKVRSRAGTAWVGAAALHVLAAAALVPLARHAVREAALEPPTYIPVELLWEAPREPEKQDTQTPPAPQPEDVSPASPAPEPLPAPAETPEPEAPSAPARSPAEPAATTQALTILRSSQAAETPDERAIAVPGPVRGSTLRVLQALNDCRDPFGEPIPDCETAPLATPLDPNALIAQPARGDRLGPEFARMDDEEIRVALGLQSFAYNPPTTKNVSGAVQGVLPLEARVTDPGFGD